MSADGIEQRIAKALVHLHDVDVANALGKVLREDAEPAADLEHDVRSAEPCGTADHAEDVRVDEEVLAELAVRPHGELAHPAHAGLNRRVGHRAHPQPNTRAPLRSRVSPSSSASTPRSCARKAAVCTT